MKGSIEAFGMTLLFLVILFAVITIGALIIFFTFNNQAKFSNDYAVLSGKAHSIAEVFAARNYETKTGEELVFREVIGEAVPYEYRDPIVKAAVKYEISPNLVAAIFKCGEHGKDMNGQWPNINGPWASSPVGAAGPFQFMPGSWETYKDDCNGDNRKDIQNIYDAACAAANHLKTRMEWPAKYDDKIKTTIWYYNNADWYVDRVYSCYLALGGSVGFFQKDTRTDNRNAFDHSLAMAMTTDVEKSMSAGFVNDIEGFMDRYELGFYSIDVSKDNEVIRKVIKAGVFCGNLEKSCSGSSQQTGYDTKCIAYCEPSLCSPGREKYKQGDEVCGKGVCCAEKYNWQDERYASYASTETPCFGGKGLCAKNCVFGREHVAEYDTDCKGGNTYSAAQNSKNKMCCTPVLPENIPKVSELGTEISVPLLYKITKNDPDGVLGYLTIGVSKD
ncbi:MAG: lytic transglycosylase domain-containing protein [Candidatus Aenigmarchaeota archaeon]|nr:lytic transglycosylase domain-containing protein [Candidatus Aenigmarchaeota archaeon]